MYIYFQTRNHWPQCIPLYKIELTIYITILYETQVLILQQTSALCIQSAKDGHLRIRNDVVLSADLFCSHLFPQILSYFLAKYEGNLGKIFFSY